LVKNSLVI